MDPVTTVAAITLTLLALVLLITATLSIFLIAEEVKDQRQRKADAERLTQGGTIS